MPLCTETPKTWAVCYGDWFTDSPMTNPPSDRAEHLRSKFTWKPSLSLHAARAITVLICNPLSDRMCPTNHRIERPIYNRNLLSRPRRSSHAVRAMAALMSNPPSNRAEHLQSKGALRFSLDSNFRLNYSWVLFPLGSNFRLLVLQFFWCLYFCNFRLFFCRICMMLLPSWWLLGACLLHPWYPLGACLVHIWCNVGASLVHPWGIIGASGACLVPHWCHEAPKPRSQEIKKPNHQPPTTTSKPTHRAQPHPIRHRPPTTTSTSTSNICRACVQNAYIEQLSNI